MPATPNVSAVRACNRVNLRTSGGSPQLAASVQPSYRVDDHAPEQLRSSGGAIVNRCERATAWLLAYTSKGHGDLCLRGKA